MGRRADFSLTASPGSLLEVAASASGARIVDEDGRSYLDACGGAMVMSLGHCHPRLVEVVQRQVAELSFTYRFSFRNGPMLELAEELRSVSPLADTWCFFNSSGSESVESAIQLARRYWQLRGRPGQDRPDLPLAVVPRLDARRALALGLQVAGVLRVGAGQAPGGSGAECRHPPAPRRPPRRPPGPRASSRMRSCAAAQATSPRS